LLKNKPQHITFNQPDSGGAPLSHGEGKGVRGVLLTHPGTQYAPRLAASLHKQGVLQCFATGIAFPDTPAAWWWKLARLLGKEKLLLKRVIPGLPEGKIFCQPVKEAIAIFRHQVLKQGNDAVFYPRNKAFQEQLPQRLINRADAVIGFDTSSWILARRCRAAGKPFYLDVSIAHPLAKEQVYARLREKYPLWAEELKPKMPRNITVELGEIELAHHLVVASTFTKNTYLQFGVPPEKISVNAYGTDLGYFKSKWDKPVQRASDIRKAVTFLFFGSLSARKGFPWLCEVWKKFHQRYPHCRLQAAGYNLIPPGFTVPEGVEVWGPIHPKDRAALFAGADVFVFPSFFEGFAQVLLEAMASGLPVITTNATAGPDLFTTGNEGRIINPGEDAELEDSLSFFADQPELIEFMGRAARLAAEGFSWDAYGERWKGIVVNG
jgi:glycosyltransferase involved in cell wall biosynthesis